MALQDHRCIEMEASDAETLVLGEGDTSVLGEQHTTTEQIKEILMMDVAKVEENSPPLLEEAGVESAWRDAMNIVDVLHDKTPEQNCICVQPLEMHAMNWLLYEKMKGISAHIGKAARRLEGKAKAMRHMHRNARKLVKKFYHEAKKTRKIWQ